MSKIVHILSPYKKCPFNCPFCCAKDDSQEKEIELSDNYWQNLKHSLWNGAYNNAMITGETEPTLFPEWIDRVVEMCDSFGIVTELRTHNYKYIPTNSILDQTWYSITDAAMLPRLQEIYNHGIQFSMEVNFALLINKDFYATDIIRARLSLPDSKFTVRYLLDQCTSPKVSQWVRENKRVFSTDIENTFKDCDIRVKSSYENLYDIIRQDGNIIHEWQ